MTASSTPADSARDPSIDDDEPQGSVPETRHPPGTPDALEQAGTHPLGTSMGAIGGAVAGAITGIAAGPVGSLAGAVAGALAGGALGSGAATPPTSGPVEHTPPTGGGFEAEGDDSRPDGDPARAGTPLPPA